MLRISRLTSSRLSSAYKGLSTSASSAESLPQSYSVPVQFFHWTMGFFVAGATGLVLVAQKTQDKQDKQKLMFLHKSFGLAAFILLGPRLVARISSKTPAPLPGSSQLQDMLAKAGHVALYSLAIALPVSGVVMGSFSGFGLPFFFTTFPSVKKEPSVAKQAFEFHKLAGQAIEYMIPIHVAGALFHVFKGQAIFGRILGFLNKAPKTPK